MNNPDLSFQYTSDFPKNQYGFPLFVFSMTNFVNQGADNRHEYLPPQLKDTETLELKGKKSMPASGEIVWLPREASHTGVMGTRAIPLT